jgi:hypothetical protein
MTRTNIVLLLRKKLQVRHSIEIIAIFSGRVTWIYTKERHLVECCIGETETLGRVFSRLINWQRTFKFCAVCQHIGLSQIVMSTEPNGFVKTSTHAALKLTLKPIAPGFAVTSQKLSYPCQTRRQHPPS